MRVYIYVSIRKWDSNSIIKYKLKTNHLESRSIINIKTSKQIKVISLFSKSSTLHHLSHPPPGKRKQKKLGP